MGYTKQAIKGVSWMGVFRIVTRAIAFGKIIILARILTKDQFGLFGIASLILAFIELITETGINIFLIQCDKKIHEYLNTAWVVSIIRGIVIAGVIIISAPFIASFFNAPDVYNLLLLISIVPILRGFINPAVVSFQKNLEFRKEFFYKLTVFCVESTITVIMALFLRNAFSFVLGLILGALIEVIISFVFIKLRPKIQLELAKVKTILHKGKNITLMGIFSYIAQEGDDAVVGKMLGTSTLGLYQVAYPISTLPISEITNVINSVVFPVYTKFTEDKKRLRRAFLKTTTVSSIAAVFLGTAIIIFAEFILSMLGKQWIEGVAVVQILAIYGIFRTVFGNFAPLFLALGKQEYIAKTTFVRVIGLLVTIVPLVVHYGLIGAGYAALISIIVEIPIILFFALRVLR